MPKADRQRFSLRTPQPAEGPARLRRRSFLSLSLAMLVCPRAALALPAPPPSPQRLQLVNAHTGEKFDGPYRDAHGPLASAMADLSQFLRDFHSGAEIAYDVRVIDFLASVMDAVGQTSATVLSAYRTPETNAMLARTTFGVAEHSQHMYGRALDIYFGPRLADAVRIARAMQRGGVGWYPRSAFMHVDSGPVRNWDLDAGGIDHLLLRNDAIRGAAPEAGVRRAASQRRPSIGGHSGELLPEVSDQHRALSTQQLLARFHAGSS